MNTFNQELGLYNVVQFKNFQIGRDRSGVPKGCNHKKVELRESTNQVLCKECKEVLDPFKVLLNIVTDYSHYEERINAKIGHYNALKGKLIHFKAAKHVEKLLRANKTIPSCPHCSQGLFSEDFFKMGNVGKEFALSRLKRDSK